MLYRLGLLAVRWRWPLLGIWAALFLAALPFAYSAPRLVKPGFGRADTESERALTLLQERFGAPIASLTVVFRHPTVPATDPRFIALQEQALAPLRDAPGVRRVITHYTDANPRMVAPDGHTAYALVLLEGGIDEAVATYRRLHARLQRPPDMEVWVTGVIAIFGNLGRAAARDLRRAEAITFPIVLAALVVVFGGLVAAALPLLIGGMSVGVALALLSCIARATDVSTFALNIVTVLGLGMAVDYALLVVSRFREEIARRPLEEAVATAVDRAGRALLFSGLTTVVGMSGLLLFPFMLQRSIGIGGMLVVGIGMAAALTALPALLTTLGRRVNALSILPLREVQETWWRHIAMVVMRHSLLVIVVVGVFLVALGLPFLRVRIGAPWASILPPGDEARRGWEVLSQAFGEGELTPIVVTVQDPQGVLRPETLGRLYDFVHTLAQDPRVGRVESIVSLDPRLTRDDYIRMYAAPEAIPFPAVRAALDAMARPDVTYLRVFSRHPPLAEESKDLLRRIRQEGPLYGLQVMATGATADITDTIATMYGLFPWVALYIGGAIYLCLLFLLRSVVLPLKAVVMNALSILASYGALVFIFQEGHLEGLLRFQATGYTEAATPILLFCILYGLSMDYEVFLLARIKEAYEETGDNTRSVGVGLEKTGRIVTGAAAVLFLVTGSFVISEVLLLKALGVGIALAVLLDTTVVRALLVPATMRVLGQWNWWAPRWLRGKARPPLYPPPTPA
jgi:putative drug exporter of the RND superfamily